MEFDTNHSVYFNLEEPGTLYENFRDKFYQIHGYIAELKALHMIIEQRIETLEKMSDVVSYLQSAFLKARLTRHFSL